ncbi:MAG: hypothetical protein ACK46L_06325 [Synechococcaceae cyanobacterium]
MLQYRQRHDRKQWQIVGFKLDGRESVQLRRSSSPIISSLEAGFLGPMVEIAVECGTKECDIAFDSQAGQPGKLDLGSQKNPRGSGGLGAQVMPEC